MEAVALLILGGVSVLALVGRMASNDQQANAAAPAPAAPAPAAAPVPAPPAPPEDYASSSGRSSSTYGRGRVGHATTPSNEANLTVTFVVSSSGERVHVEAARTAILRRVVEQAFPEQVREQRRIRVVHSGAQLSLDAPLSRTLVPAGGPQRAPVLHAVIGPPGSAAPAPSPTPNNHTAPPAAAAAAVPPPFHNNNNANANSQDIFVQHAFNTLIGGILCTFWWLALNTSYVTTFSRILLAVFTLAYIMKLKSNYID